MDLNKKNNQNIKVYADNEFVVAVGNSHFIKNEESGKIDKMPDWLFDLLLDEQIKNETNIKYFKIFDAIDRITDNEISKIIYGCLKDDYKYCGKFWYIFNSLTGKWYKSDFGKNDDIKAATTDKILPSLMQYEKNLKSSLNIQVSIPKYASLSQDEILFIYQKQQEVAETYKLCLSDFFAGNITRSKSINKSNLPNLMKIIETEKLDPKYSFCKEIHKAAVSNVFKELETFLIDLDVNPILQKLKKIEKVREILEGNKTLTEVCSINIAKFQDLTIEEKLDSQRHLMGFDNGVYDFELKRFRKCGNTDYLTYSTKFNYDKNVNETIKQEIINCIKQIQSDEENEKYLWSSLASCLFGQNIYSLFHVWTGVGSNGKSFLAETMCNVLGDYAGSMKSTYLTTFETSPDNHTSGLSDVMKKRFVYMSETLKNSKFNAALMKELTGGYKFNSRGLYQGGKSLIPYFVLFLLCNDLPEITEDLDEYSLKRRIRSMKYRNKFVNTPKLPNEKQLDGNLSKKFKLEEYKNAFFHILLEKFNTLNPATEPTQPNDVINASSNMLLNVDTLLDNWIERRLKKTHAKTNVEPDILAYHQIEEDMKTSILENVKDLGRQ